MPETMHRGDIYHLTVAGANPHDVATEISQMGSPFYDPTGSASVAQEYAGQRGGIVEVWCYEHLTPEQQAYLNTKPYIIDIRHVWPEE